MTTASYTGVVVSLSPLVAPTIGGYIQHWFGWHAVFFTLALLFFLAGVCFLCLCPESNHHRHDDACSFKKLRHNYSYILRQPIFLVSTLISGITMSAVIACATLSAFLLQQHFHLSVVTYGWVTSAVGTGAIVGRYMSSRSVRYFGREKPLSSHKCYWYVQASGSLLG